MDALFVKTERQKQLFTKISELADRFSERSEEIDQTGSFPFQNIEELKSAGYTSLTVPKKYGGEGTSLYELVLLQERLAQGDASTALSIGWHLGIIMDLGNKEAWKAETYEKLCKEVVNAGVLINSAVTEPMTGSPTRGAKMQTTAKKEGNHWVLNGRKTFTTMSPVLDYFIVVASASGKDDPVQFLVPRETDGLRVDETWNTMAMRGTGSHDLILENVILPEESLVQELDAGSKSKASGWLLHIPACYLGIAVAARNYVVEFANSYSPNSISGTIGELSNVQQAIGSLEIELMNARYFLYSIARKWDEEPETRYQLQAELGAAKHVAVNTALSVIDQAMRITGAQSLFQSNPLQRYYRDARAGLHNPPMDDAVISLLAKKALDKL
ncbi:acyl-CoA dehydrogenase [Bacillus taeanensis]|uniref:Acyl-CoA dehydrogenase n=1 Tax=Bacillus taeanensis TaxID=273032 RepID=A0A366Y431_9BACI|nr:acyl-CoA dehydrogenase family protein [Bacillus taeanensis]RBW71173.1 acyl-CoA dehydrogenase [Bacillus taeanensis]